MEQVRTYSGGTTAALKVLGGRIRAARIKRRMTVAELAERLGVNRQTVTSIEQGRPSVRIGVVFEAASVLNVPLFAEDARRVRAEVRAVESELALLPERARKRVIDDAF